MFASSPSLAYEINQVFFVVDLYGVNNAISRCKDQFK